MHNPAELNESLERRVDLLTEKVLFLEQQIKSLTDSQGGEIPPGMAPVSTLNLKALPGYFWPLTLMRKHSLSFCVLRPIPKMKPVRS